jgi:thiamine pyrophosphate-dependent acetolactate synthase large subunit-like protein
VLRNAFFYVHNMVRDGDECGRAALTVTAGRMSFAQAIAAGLAAEGTTDAFGIMGSGNMRVLHHLAHDHGVAFHAARHEAAALAAADGFARATDRAGVCIVTQGPGLTNTLTALITARKANTPLVLVTGDSSGIDSPADPFARVQAIPYATLMEAAGVPVVRAEPATVQRDVRDAFALAGRALRPVALVMPYEYELAPAGEVESLFSRNGAALAGADAAALDEAAHRLLAAERPLLLAGRGAARAGAGDALRRLADELGAVLGTSLPASGLFGGHPGDLGLVGGFARPSVQAAVNACDCVLAVGAGLNGFTTHQGSLMAGAHVIQCDSDPEAFGRFRPASSRVVGDARLVAEGLHARVRARGGPRSAVRSVPEVAAALARPRSDPFDDASTERLLDPRALCTRLDELLPRDRAVVTDGGRFVSHVVRRVHPHSPDALLYMQEFGSVGGGLGAAIGAAVGRPERLTALFIGDSGLMMTLGDLDVAVREGIALLVVCMNDEALGSEITLLGDAGLDVADAYMATPDLAAVARSMGAQGERIEALEQLDALPVRLAELRGPLVLDCRVLREGVGA